MKYTLVPHLFEFSVWEADRTNVSTYASCLGNFQPNQCCYNYVGWYSISFNYKCLCIFVKSICFDQLFIAVAFGFRMRSFKNPTEASFKCSNWFCMRLIWYSEELCHRSFYSKPNTYIEIYSQKAIHLPCVSSYNLFPFVKTQIITSFRAGRGKKKKESKRRISAAINA